MIEIRKKNIIAEKYSGKNESTYKCKHEQFSFGIFILNFVCYNII